MPLSQWVLQCRYRRCHTRPTAPSFASAGGGIQRRKNIRERKRSILKPIIMSDFRTSQNQAHPNKTNTLLTGIILLLILFVSIQIWFLFGALNNALDDNFYFALTTFIGSLILAISSFWLLRYLPDPIKQKSKKNRPTDRLPS